MANPMTTSSSRTSQLTTAELAFRCLTVTFTGAEGLSGGGEAPEPEHPLLRGPGPLSPKCKSGEGHATWKGGNQGLHGVGTWACALAAAGPGLRGLRLLVSRVGAPAGHNWPYQGSKLKWMGLGQGQI